MTPPARSYHGYRFPPEIISHAVWLYHRFSLSFRDTEDLLAHRGITVSYEAIRHWCRTFGPDYARTLRHRRDRMGDTWHLDELFVTIRGHRHYLWRAVDQGGDVLDILVQSRRDRGAAARFFRRLLKRAGQGTPPADHGQAAQLFSGAPYRDAFRGPQHATVREQPSGGLASTDTATRGPDATVQVCRTRATFPVGSWRRTESLPCRPSPLARRPPSPAANAFVPRLGWGDVCLLNDEGSRSVESAPCPHLRQLDSALEGEKTR